MVRAVIKAWKEGAASMAQLFSFSPVTKVVLVGIWVVFTIGLGVMFIQRLIMKMPDGDVASVHIALHLAEELQRLNLHFGILHVRDGKDEVPGHGDLLNQEIPFQPIDRRGTIVAAVQYQKRLGFQFKCFVDPGSVEYERVQKLLEAAKFSDVSKGEGTTFRIWFILPDYPKYKTTDGISNNYYYPA